MGRYPRDEASIKDVKPSSCSRSVKHKATARAVARMTRDLHARPFRLGQHLHPPPLFSQSPDSADESPPVDATGTQGESVARADITDATHVEEAGHQGLAGHCNAS